MSHVFDRTKARDLSVFFLFLFFFFVRQTAQKKLSYLLCISVSHAFTDVFADAGALLPNGTTTGGFSVAFEAKEGGRAIIVVSFTRRR